DLVTFGPGYEDEQREETDEQCAERYARYKQLWQSYLKETNELLKSVAGKWLASPEQYELAGYGYVFKAYQSGGASIH
ncbi:hypothetical protein, partial [Enterobacter hormaechei]